MSLDAARLETLVIARLFAGASPQPAREVAEALLRFAPPSLERAAWLAEVERAMQALRDHQIVDDSATLRDREELARRIGTHAVRTWSQLVDRVLPGLALGVAPDDAKTHARLSGRDAWAAAIAARSIGIWTEGPPPTLAVVCDAYAWRSLGLTGKPKRCPPEVRALFIQRELDTTPGPPDRLLRLFASREIGAPRADLRSLRDGLVRRWLEGRPLAGNRTTRSTAITDHFPQQVRETIGPLQHGVFGDRKVFIAAAWAELRARPRWAQLSLDDFKARLVTAHREGALVLARADLVAAMDPELVSKSEIRTGDASFHFIVREPP